MKVAVITLWENFTNYGQILQCWALQKAMIEHGDEPYIVRFLPMDRLRKERQEKLLKVYPLFKVLRNRLLRKRQNIYDKLNSTGMKEWALSNIKYSDNEYYNIRQLRSNPPIADCYVAGSDQIWLQDLRYSDNYAYFLDFGKKEVKRVAYAPSFGMEEYPKRNIKELERLLKNFDAVSVREKAGVRICEQCGIKAVNVVDPTLLLQQEDYLKLIEPLNGNNGGGVFLYNINIRTPEDIRWQELKTLADEKRLPVLISQGVGFEISNESLGEKEKYKYLTMGQWLAGIKQARLAVASSFHCVVFSIIFNTPFVYAPIKGSHSIGNNRALDLMKGLGLENRVLTEDKPYKWYLENPIDWESVNKKLQCWREESQNFLFQFLK